ncbi:MAG: hypothetical protein L7H18_05330 [Candidatus Nealsonbacteria bacterium DGGOD1a]|nr:MAG: hypothetical protein L7H18_05330 [Candidatus Nealsonbacteria bacterium DGGOD1a]
MVGHSKLYAHHQYIIGGEIAAVVGLDVLDDSSLQKPAYLPAVNRIAGQPVKLPADYALRFALFNPRQHIGKYRSARNLS